MIKRWFGLFISVLLTLSTFGLTPSSANASPQTPEEKASKEKAIQIAKEYIQRSSSDLSNRLSKLRGKDVTFEEVNKVISDYYKQNPAPQMVANDPTISIEDVFPKKVEKYKSRNKGKPFVITDFLKKQRQNEEDGELISLNRKNDGTIDVFVSDIGGVIGCEFGTVDNELSKKAKTKSSGNVGIAAYTPTKRTTCVAYTALGDRAFTLWAEGRFYYDGKTSWITHADGDYQRHLFGSTMVLEPRALGKMRTVYIEGHRYSEVYSRLYYEAVFGIRWAGIVLASDTVETSVGVTVTGNTYGRCIRL
ncbi:hypothetical protein CLV97_13314 [Planifilum fimeticola]|uniref:Uncharacterized protein n=1 Tax=Planifilum fimeticola TaxID=201975 RepID=A0A2T0LAQ5_9BACL|nr:hypothetical protein [Planifilum fimeticola]PRX38913.1 hypothetical protein CLV97_13314 [Planifilum fimeticola]